MTNVDWFQIIGGFGIFFLSLRFLNRILSQSIFNSLKPYLNYALQNRSSCLLSGFLLTILVQSSSISIITSAGLLQTSLIHLEQGFMIMLGSTVGTTVKSWFFATSIHEYGVVIIGLGSFALIFVRRAYLRAVIEAITVIGLSFASLHMLESGLKPALLDSSIHNFFIEYDASSLPKQLYIIIFTCCLTMLVQSSSITVFIILEMVQQGTMPFNLGVLCVLGANIGTTITPLIASMEYRKDVKRLAISYVLIKILGVMLATFLFPFFLSVVDIIVPGSTTQYTMLHIAAAHTLFNIFNVILWYLLTTPIIRWLFFIIPGKNVTADIALPYSVRKMLENNPKQAFIEIQKQMERIRNINKELIDYSFILLTEKQINQYKPHSTVLMKRKFDNIREAIYELLIKVRLQKQKLSDNEQEYIDKLTIYLNQETNFYCWNVLLKDHVDQGVFILSYEFSSEIKDLLQKYQEHFNQLWLLILQKKPLAQETSLQQKLELLKKLHAKIVMESEEDETKMYWLYDTIRYLENMIDLFHHWHQ